MAEQKSFDDKLQAIFAEESIDFVRELDELIMKLEAEEQKNSFQETIGVIFRIIHTLKASTSTLGYSELSKFLHIFEYLITDLKEQTMPFDKDVKVVLYDMSGIVKEDIEAVIKNKTDLPEKRYRSSVNNLKELYKSHQKELGFLSGEKKQNTKGADADNDGTNYFQIVFVPDASLLRNGTDPLIFFHELKSLGELINVNVNTDNIPLFNDFVIDELYCSWELILKTKQSKKTIADVFLFVEHVSQIKIEDITNRYSKDGVEKTANKKLGDLLLERGKVEVDEVTLAVAKQDKIGKILVQDKIVSEKTLNKALDDQKSSQELVSTSVRVNIQKLDALVNLVGELVISQSRNINLANKIKDSELKRLLLLQSESTHRIITDLQDGILNTRMVAIDTTFTQFHRVVRDLSLKQGKKIKLMLTGQETELDKNVIEKINSPLKHMVRNSIDHGIETPEERDSAGKPKEAIVHLKAYHKEGNVYLEISDDGKGLDKDLLYKKGIEKGLISDGENLSDDEIYNLIFHPGFSTAKEVSDVSGRGVGMDVVKRAIKDLRGKISIVTEKGKGTTFTIKLPLTLAIIDGLLFSVGSQIYIIPLLSVIDTLRPRKEHLKTIEGRGEYIILGEEVSTLIRLHHLFDIADGQSEPTAAMVLNVEVDLKKYSLLVDDILGQEQIVLKSLEENYRKIEGFSGATILGDGGVAMIIDTSDLVQLFKRKINYIETTNTQKRPPLVKEEKRI